MAYILFINYVHFFEVQPCVYEQLNAIVELHKQTLLTTNEGDLSDIPKSTVRHSTSLAAPNA